MRAVLPEMRLRVDRACIRKYAHITRDTNPIHLDPDFAKATPMGGIIAHGTLSMSLIWQSLSQACGPSSEVVIQLSVRFLRPVREGDLVVAGGTLSDPSGVYAVWARVEAATRSEVVISGTARIGAATAPAADAPRLSDA
jgi:acyl dehydratase